MRAKSLAARDLIFVISPLHRMYDIRKRGARKFFIRGLRECENRQLTNNRLCSRSNARILKNTINHHTNFN